ncbi:MAG: hypothetical protein IIA02_10570 [Proteobacteria bacterium]|nr:hypothetical protein [Pseudomonadota bacterium]
MGRPPKPPLYVLPHGIEVIGEYPPNKHCKYWRVRLRPHPFFPGVREVFGGIYVHRSRAVLASKLGRALTPTDHAHHGNELKDHDTAENLELLSASEHNRHHKVGAKHSLASRQKTSETLKALYASGQRDAAPLHGSSNGCAKLTDAQALAIKFSTESTKTLVARYGVSRTTVKQIRNGSIWRHLK